MEGFLHDLKTVGRYWASRFFASNHSLHSQYFQYALALAITSVVGLLISEWFNLHESHWVLITIVIILMPFRFETSLGFDKAVHSIIGTFIGAAIGNVIISNIDNLGAITLLAFLETGILAYLLKTKNYAFQVMFITVLVLLVDTFANPSTGSIDSFARLENTIIGCLLSLLTAFIIGIISKTRSNRALGSIKEGN